MGRFLYITAFTVEKTYLTPLTVGQAPCKVLPSLEHGPNQLLQTMTIMMTLMVTLMVTLKMMMVTVTCSHQTSG